MSPAATATLIDNTTLAFSLILGAYPSWKRGLPGLILGITCIYLAGDLSWSIRKYFGLPNHLTISPDICQMVQDSIGLPVQSIVPYGLCRFVNSLYGVIFCLPYYITAKWFQFQRSRRRDLEIMNQLMDHYRSIKQPDMMIEKM